MTISDAAAVELLTSLVGTPSLCGQEDAVAELLLAAMRGAGVATRRDEVGNVIGEFGPASSGDRVPSVVLLGHMDTVPGAVLVEQRDGLLYGRGTVDAKGPLATAVVAAARARARARAGITVIGAVQEEGPSVGARHLMQRAAPDYLIIVEPSGWDALVMGYKGSQRFTASITQPCAHSSVPEPTAAERAVTFWNALVAWSAQQGMPEKCDQFHRLTPTLLSMQSHSDGLHDTASLHIGLRLPPGIALQALESGVRGLLPEGDLSFSPGESAVRGDKGNPLVAGFLRSVRAEGGTPRFKVKTGTSDMNVVGPVWSCPMLAYGPGDSRLDHTPEEHTRIDEYLRAIRVLTRVLEGL